MSQLGTALGMLSLPGAAAQAQPWAHRFTLEQWTTEQGLPVNSATDLLQDRRGYLWITTHDGVARFDGKSFRVMDPASTPGMISAGATRVLETADSTIWLVDALRNLLACRDNACRRIGAGEGLTENVRLARTDRQGTLWIMTTRRVGVMRGQTLHTLVSASGAPAFEYLAPDNHGGAWYVRDGRLHHVEQNGKVTAPVAATELRAGTAAPISIDSGGRAWLVSATRQLWTAAHGEAFRPLAAVDAQSPVQSVRAASQPDIAWVQTTNALLRVDARIGTVDVLQRGPGLSAPLGDFDGLPLYQRSGELYWGAERVQYLAANGRSDVLDGQQIHEVLTDREGSHWIATDRAGLHRITHAPVSTMTVRDGLPGAPILATFVDPHGDLWIKPRAQVIHVLRDNRTVPLQLAPLDSATGAMAVRDDSTVLIGLERGEHPMATCHIRTLVCRTEPGDRTSEASASALLPLADGSVLVGTTRGLLRRRSDGTWEDLSARHAEPMRHVVALVRSADGAIWIGTAGHGLYRLRGDQLIRIESADGLPSEVVTALHLDVDGGLWITTYGRGLGYLQVADWHGPERRGLVRHIDQRNGLTDNSLVSITEDADGRLWMGANHGLIAVDRRTLARVAQGSADYVHFEHFDEKDGLLSGEANGGTQPAAARLDKRRMAFSTQAGVAIVDLDRITIGTAPHALIEQVDLESDQDTGRIEMSVNGRSRLQIPAALRDVSILFTGLTLQQARHAQFRYRLLGYDAHWHEIGNRRVARFTQLPAGTLRFELQVRLSGQPWPAQTTTLELELIPRWYERWSVRFLAIIAVILALVQRAKHRVRAVAARAAELERLLTERTAVLRARERDLAAQNEALEQSAARIAVLSADKDRFFQDLSHELRTPLTLTIGPLRAIEELVHALPSGGRLLHLSRTARRNATRVLDLLNELLLLERLGESRATPVLEPVRLPVLVNGVLALFATECERRSLVMNVQIDVSLETVLTDRRAVEKMLTNLVANAIRHSPEHGRVRVAVEVDRPASTDQEWMRIIVNDDGMGVPPADRERIFERFHSTSVESAADGSPIGIGIGLALVRGLADQHGGRIVVDDQGVLRGANFVLSLPLTRVADSAAVAAPQDERLHESAAPPRSASDELPRLLIIDDDPGLLEFLAEAMAESYQVVTESDPTAVLRRVREAPPDLVLCDLAMPQENGIAVCRALRREPLTQFVPILLMSGRAHRDDRIQALDSGADGFIEKPFDVRELRSRIDALLRLRERTAIAPPSAQAMEPAPSCSFADEFPSLSPAERDWATRLKRTIDEQLHSPEFGVLELAREMAMDRSTLRRKTRELLEHSPVDLLRQARLARASARLITSEASLAEVAYACGFSSTAYFCKVFKDHQGCTPSEFRDRTKPAARFDTDVASAAATESSDETRVASA